MKIFKTFETWNNNIIDDSLFVSGRAKYDPKVAGGKIRYKTGNIEPYYFAEIERKGDKFVCKVFKKKKNGEEIRLRNKIKKTLKLAHNYVREFLNQKLKRKDKDKDKSSKKGREDFDKVMREEPGMGRFQNDTTFEPPSPAMSLPSVKPKSRTIIRRY